MATVRSLALIGAGRAITQVISKLSEVGASGFGVGENGEAGVQHVDDGGGPAGLYRVRLRAIGATSTALIVRVRP